MKLQRKYKQLGQTQFIKWVMSEIENNGQNNAQWVKDARQHIKCIINQQNQTTPNQIPKYKLIRFIKGINITI